MRRHYFLIAALCAVALMVVAGGLRLFVFKPARIGAGGPPAAAGAGPGGAAAGQRPGGPGGPGGARGGGTQVTATTAAARPFTQRIDVLGVAKGLQSITLTSNTTQLVTAVHFRDGQTVQRGQVLVELRATEQDAGVDQAQAAVEAARLNFERYNTLAEKGIAAPATREIYRASYDQAKASLAAAQARLGDRVIRAPFAGVVGLTDIAPGALINPGTAVATLDDLSRVRVDFDVPDRFLSRLKQGTPIIAHTDSYPTQAFEGVIAQLDTRVNERTRTIKARAELSNRSGLLKPGMLVRIGVEESSRQSIGAPEAAVQFDGDQAFVFVLHRAERRPGAAGAGTAGARRQGAPGAGAPGAPGAGQRPAPRGMPATVERRSILAGQRQDGFVEIRNGLEPGDQIVADGVNRLQNNQFVLVTSRDGVEAGQGRPAGQGAGGQRRAGAQGAAGGQFAPTAPGGQRAAGAEKRQRSAGGQQAAG